MPTTPAVTAKPTIIISHTVVAELHGHGAKRVLLKPLLIASGMHAARDLAGPGADSWQSRLTAAGFTTVIQPAGLGVDRGE